MKTAAQGATEMFMPEFEKEENLWNVISEMSKNRDAKRASFKRLPKLFEMSGNQFNFFLFFAC